jgi:hypothetical protein
MFCNHEVVNIFKRAIRRLWKRIPDSEIHFLTIDDLLFLHHTQIGLSYFAVRNHKSPALARSKTYRTVTEQVTYSHFDNFAEEIISGTTRALTVDNIRSCPLIMDAESVFVSFTTCDGNKLSVIVLGPNRICNSFIHETAEDWHAILKEYRINACEEIRFQVANNEPYPWVSPPPEVLKLFYRIVFVALRVNPKARRLLLHCDQMWNIVPWQYLLRTSMKAQVEKQFDLLRRQGKRRSDGRDFAGLLIWRVSGILPNQPRMRSNYRPSDVVSDDTDLDCSQFGSKWKDKLKEGAYPAGHLSVIAHGEQKIFTNVRMYGEPISSSELSTRFAGFDVVILHVCSAADVIGTAKTGDTGGLPALFLTNGVQLVIAPTLPIPFTLINIAEPYLQQIDQDLGFVDVEKHYSNAIQENQTVAMYTLFSDELVAPRLMIK